MSECSSPRNWRWVGRENKVPNLEGRCAIPSDVLTLFSTSMLTLFRSIRGAKEVSRHVRTLTAIASSASLFDIGAAEQPHGTPLDETTVTRKRRSRLERSDAECMFVAPWNGIRSSAEGLAIASAMQEKYGPAKEVIFPRVRHMSRVPKSSCLALTVLTSSQDQESTTVFQPYFWLVFDNADVRKLLPDDSAQIRVRVADLPKSDGNVGVEEMVHALGLSMDKVPSFKPPTSTEGESEEGSADAADGYKNIDVRIEWARTSSLVCTRIQAPLTFFF